MYRVSAAMKAVRFRRLMSRGVPATVTTFLSTWDT